MPHVVTPEFIPSNIFDRTSPQEIFQSDKPFEVDLGCGDGSFLLDMASHYPERNFLGIERLLGRVRGVCKRARNLNLPNVKLLRIESLYALQYFLPEHSVSRLHLLCPDPWPKARHHRRRLVQQPFLDALCHILVPGGEFLFKTDHSDYFDWVLEHVARDPRFEKLPWQDGDFFYPKTDFQRQWESQGLTIQMARYRLIGK